MKPLAGFLFLIILAFPTLTHAENMVRAELVALENRQGEVRLGVVLHHQEGWHSYYKDAGDAGLPTELKWTLPPNYSAGEIDWPPPQTFSEGGLTTYGYTGNVTLPVTLHYIAGNTATTQDNTVRVKASWLACKDICIPEQQELTISLPHPAQGATIAQDSDPVTSNSQNGGLLATLLLALLGGVILNFMPCVLPVLSLKALSLVKKSGKARAHTIGYGVAYTVGVLASFAVIAAILIGLQKSGEAVGWGYQMQFPAFIAFLIYLVFAVGLSLSGAFHLPVLLGGVGGSDINENSIKVSRTIG